MNANMKKRLAMSKVDRNELERLKEIIRDGYEIECKLGFLKIGESDHTTVMITLFGKHGHSYSLCVEDHQLIDMAGCRCNQLDDDLNTIKSALEEYDGAVAAVQEDHDANRN